MPQDGSVRNGSGKGLGIDPSRVLVWDTAGCLNQFHDIVENPPLHSLVVHIEPAAAEQLLLVTNNRNRPLSAAWAKRLAAQAQDGYELTGDTIKFSKTGAMLDGQHRLDLCVRSKKPIVSHVVFGLDDSIFDILDQAKKRTPGDIVALHGVDDFTLVAASISWVVKIGNGMKGSHGGQLTPRQVGKLAVGEHKGIADYLKPARLINVAYKHPPSMIAAILYLIGRRDPGLARNFAHEWVHGAKIDRNENFDVLSGRLLSIAHQGGGHVNMTVRAALIVLTFNFWNAGIVAATRNLSWKKSLKFPSLEFDKDAFKKRWDREAQEDTSLNATQMRVFKALSEAAGNDKKVQMSLAELAERSHTPKGSIHYIARSLVTRGAIAVTKQGNPKSPPVYRIKMDAEELIA